MPDLPDWWQQRLEAKSHLVHFQKVYPKELTDAEEGPDQKRAREKVAMVLERDGGRLGAGDKSGVEATLDRKLAQRLYLVVCVDGTWQFPQAAWSSGQTAHACVMQGVARRCGSTMTLHALGNAPIAHLELADDAKVFYYRLLLTDGDVELGDGVSDHAWLTKDELGERLDPATSALAADFTGPYP